MTKIKESDFIKIDKIPLGSTWYEIINVKIGKYWYGLDRKAQSALYKLDLGDNGNLISDYGNVGSSDGHYIRVSKNHKFSYIDNKGNFIFKTKYKFIMLVVDNIFAYRNCRNKWGLLDNKGNKITEAIYDNDPQWIEYKDYITVEQKGKWGIIDCQGNIIIPLEYDDSFAFCFFIDENTGMIVAQKNNKYGVINFKNEIIIPFEYDSISSSNGNSRIMSLDNKVIASKNNKFGIINKKGDVLLDFQFDSLSFLSDETIIIEDYEKDVSYIADYSGKRVCDTDFYYISTNSYKQNKYFVAKLEENDKAGIIDKYGNTVLDFKYKSIKIEHNSKINKTYFVVMYKNGQENILDENGKELLSCNYESLEIVKNNYIVAKKNGKEGLIDFNNNVIIDFNFDMLDLRQNYEFHLAKTDEKYAFINVKGEIKKIDLSKAKELKI